MKKYNINFILIFILIPLKIVDFWMSLEYIGTNGIIEGNPLGHILLESPILVIVILSVLFIVSILSNFIFKELTKVLFIVFICLNIIAIYILFNNFKILLEVL